jgi:small neutral amino acid transporter SnatA (MarC family)
VSVAEFCRHLEEDALARLKSVVPCRGASTLATLLLLQRTVPSSTVTLLLVPAITWAISAAILLSSTFLYRVLGERGLIAMERLMGMLLVMVAVQMLMMAFPVSFNACHDATPPVRAD